MIVTLSRLMGETLTAVVPAGTQVFDGKDWIVPRVGGYATLLSQQSTNAQINDLSYLQSTTQVCMITAVDSIGPADTQLVQVADPVSGDYPCLVCNLGTQLLNIKVTK